MQRALENHDGSLKPLIQKALIKYHFYSGFPATTILLEKFSYLVKKLHSNKGFQNVFKKETYWSLREAQWLATLDAVAKDLG